jgi:hypothetical protein
MSTKSRHVTVGVTDELDVSCTLAYGKWGGGSVSLLVKDNVIQWVKVNGQYHAGALRDIVRGMPAVGRATYLWKWLQDRFELESHDEEDRPLA